MFNPFTNKPLFLRVCCTGLLKTLWVKKKLLFTSNFSFSHSVFYHFGELSTVSIKHKIVPCKLLSLSIWKSLKFVVWERVKSIMFHVWVKDHDIMDKDIMLVNSILFPASMLSVFKDRVFPLFQIFFVAR